MKMSQLCPSYVLFHLWTKTKIAETFIACDQTTCLQADQQTRLEDCELKNQQQTFTPHTEHKLATRNVCPHVKIEREREAD